MKRFENKKVFISPYSPLTKNLKLFLKTHHITVLGFIDQNVKEENVFTTDKLMQKEYDAVLIFSPNHFESIYQNYKKCLHVRKIYKIEKKIDTYFIYDAKQIFFKTFQLSFQNFNTKLKKLFLQYFSIFLDLIKYKRTHNIFIGEGYVDANIKHLYIHYIENNKNTILLTDNKEQLEILKQHKLPCAKLGGWISHFYLAISSHLFLDHILYHYLEYLSPSQKTIQLWHGVGLKKINDMSDITYDYFISTSDWTNETNFKNVFKAIEFLSLGYPRLDIFFKEEKELDLIFCDMLIYDFVKNSKSKKILYMPTYRENELHNTPPLDFELLNKQMQEMDAYFIVKFHPFVKLERAKNLSHIIFYETQSDIYPILKYVDILVSDYSSVIYDFLLLDRPIISFNYDYEDYISHRDGFLFDYFEYSPCEFVQTQDELFERLKNHNMTDKKNKKIKELFFKNIMQNSCASIYKELEANPKER